MKTEFMVHNKFLESTDAFLQGDPHLSVLHDFKFVHPLDWWRGRDITAPGIYILTGGRQIGKTTSVKLLIKELLLEKRIEPRRILCLPCDQIDDHVQLGRLLRDFLDGIAPGGGPFFLAVDEVTFVREWDRAIKAIADEGRFRRGACLITGSDTVILKEAAQRFPGRRGMAATTDFHLKPLDFPAYVKLVDPALLPAPRDDAALLARFEEYFRCGGHLRAINDFHTAGEVLPATYAVFEQWISGDFTKRGRSERILLGVLSMIAETLGSQVTYSALANRMGEVTKMTFIDYCDLLERMDVFFPLLAFDQNRRMGSPKKARRLHFWDPFILDTAMRWLARELQFRPRDDLAAVKAESVVAAHFKARGPAFYWKGRGEIDVVSVARGDPLYLEVKWTQQPRSWDISELKKRRNAIVLTKQPGRAMIDGVPSAFLPAFLLE